MSSAIDAERPDLEWRVANNLREYRYHERGSDWCTERTAAGWVRANSTLQRVVMWINLGWVPPDDH